jgi:hypothetical protein
MKKFKENIWNWLFLGLSIAIISTNLYRIYLSRNINEKLIQNSRDAAVLKDVSDKFITETTRFINKVDTFQLYLHRRNN